MRCHWRLRGVLVLHNEPPAFDPKDLLVRLFSGAAAVAAAQPQAAAGSPLAQALASMRGSLAQMRSFIASFSGLPDLNQRLHAPVLGAGSTEEQLAVKLLRDFEGALHLLSADLPEFLGRLPRVSAAGLAAPAAGRLVRPELAGVYSGLAGEVAQLSGRLQGGGGGGAGVVVPGVLTLQHCSQVTFGRLDLAWQQAVAGAAAGAGASQQG